MNKFDHFYEDNLKPGLYHWLILAVAVLTNTCAGALFSICPFVFRFYQYEIFLTFEQIGYITMSSNFGNLVAALVFGEALAVFGRRLVLVATTSIGALSTLLFFMTNSFGGAVVAFFVFSMSIGAGIASLNIYLTEVFCSRYRARAMIVAMSSMSLGKIVGSGLLWLEATPYRVGLWRLPIVHVGIALSIALLLIVVFFRESVRYSFHKKRFTEAHQNFQAIQKMNASKKNKQQRRVYGFNSFVGAGTMPAPLKEGGPVPSQPVPETGRRYKFFVFFVSLFGNMGLILGVNISYANIVGAGDSALFNNFIIATGEIVGSVLVALLIDRKSIGRRRMLIGSNFIALCLCIYPLLLGEEWINLIFFGLRVSLKAAWSAYVIHKNESFSIGERDVTVAKIELLSSTVGLIKGPLLFKCISISHNAVFLLFVVYALIALVGDILLPPDAIRQAQASEPPHPQSKDQPEEPLVTSTSE